MPHAPRGEGHGVCVPDGAVPRSWPRGSGRQGEGRSNTFLAKAAAVGPRQGGQALCRRVCREPASASAPSPRPPGCPCLAFSSTFPLRGGRGATQSPGDV